MTDKIETTVNYNGIVVKWSLEKNTKLQDFLETAVNVFGISPQVYDRIEVSESNGTILNESAFENLIENGSSAILNLRVIWEMDTTPQDQHNDSFVFAVPEPFGSYQQNLFNQKATPVFRQNCFIFEASNKPCKVYNRFPRKLSPKRLCKSRSIRI